MVHRAIALFRLQSIGRVTSLDWPPSHCATRPERWVKGVRVECSAPTHRQVQQVDKQFVKEMIGQRAVYEVYH